MCASNHGNPAPHPHVLVNINFDAIVEVDSILMWCAWSPVYYSLQYIVYFAGTVFEAVMMPMMTTLVTAMVAT